MCIRDRTLILASRPVHCHLSIFFAHAEAAPGCTSCRMLTFTLIPDHLGMSVEGGQRTVKEVAMTKTLLIAAALIAGIGFAVAQDQVPGNKSEAATPVPPAQQNAPPDKVAPDPLNSPNAVTPDAKAEANAPALKMDSGAEKKLPASEGATSGQDTTATASVTRGTQISAGLLALARMLAMFRGAGGARSGMGGG